MAQFRIGDKARVVSIQPGVIDHSNGGLIGRVVTIKDRYLWAAQFDWAVVADGYQSDGIGGVWLVANGDLAPLLPPDEAADAFLARIKKLGSEPVNDAPKVTVREGK